MISLKINIIQKLILLLLTTGPLVFTQEPNVVWTKTYGGDMGDLGNCVQQIDDGGFIIAGLAHKD